MYNNKSLNNIKNKNLLILFMLFTFCFFIGFLSSCKPKKPNLVLPEQISLTCTEAAINQGDSLKVNAFVTPDNSDKTITWESVNPQVATVDDGNILGISQGITYINVKTTANPNVVASITVVVSSGLTDEEMPIVYNPDGGSMTENLIGKYSMVSGKNSFPIPSKFGYRFTGWYENDTLVTEIEANRNEIIFLTAHYELITLATKISIDNTPTNLYPGATFQFEPETDKLNDSFTYASSDNNIATISDSGLMSCINSGYVAITITSKSNPSLISSAYYYVAPFPNKVTIKSLNTKVFTDSTLKLNATVIPTDAVKDLIWTSSDISIAKVNDGIITPVKPGEVTIKATSKFNSEISSEIIITVVEAPKSVVLNNYDDSAYIGQTIQLSGTVSPSHLSQNIIWTSSDETIATVNSNGLVTILNRGDVYITATSQIKSDVFATAKITGLHALLENEESDVKYIISAPGTDASNSINITYHAKNLKTSIDITTSIDPTFAQARKIIPDGRYFEELDPILDGTYEARNIFHVEIGGLTPNTKYIYRINKGDNTYSDIYSFTTASDKPDDFSFVWTTDVHYYCKADGTSNGAEISEQIILKAQEKYNNIGFVLDTGDGIDTGGNSNIWNIAFEKRLSYLTLPFIGTPGNHEYYIHDTGQWDNRFFAAYNASPTNGPIGTVGSTCYFVYNDVLFLMIDNVKKTNYDEKIAWIENVLKTVPAKMVIASMHVPIQSESESNTQDRDLTMMALFEKYGVDLVLTGHYHTDSVTNNYYQGSVSNDPLIGVDYMIGAGGGIKGAGTEADAAEFAKGYVVSISGNAITVTQMNANGKIINTRTFNSIKYENVIEAKNEDLFNSLKYDLNTSKNTVTFSWDRLAYGNVEKVTISETLRGGYNKEILIITPAYSNVTLSNISNYYEFNFLVTFFFKDGTIKEKQFNINRSNGINLLAKKATTNSISLAFDEAPKELLYTIKQYDIYLNNVLYTSVTYLKNDAPITNYTIDNLLSGTNYDIKFVAVDKNDNYIFSSSVNAKTN